MQYDGSFIVYRRRKGDRVDGKFAHCPHNDCLGKFEKHTKGIGRRIMTKYGWNDSKPLGASNNEDAIKEPVEANGQNSKRGFGYHGESITCPAVVRSACVGETQRRRKNIPVVMCNQPGHRIVEPLASHSYMFPQYHNNLTLGSTSYTSLSPLARKQATPGTDGIVLSTVYDDALDIDSGNSVYRTQVPTALKKRKVVDHSPNDLSESGIRKENEEGPARNVNGSKLVNPQHWCKADEDIANNSGRKRAFEYVGEGNRSHSSIGNINFVRPVDTCTM